MSFDEIPSDAQPPRLEEGEIGATDRETSASDAPPAVPVRRRRAPRSGTDAASAEKTAFDPNTENGSSTDDSEPETNIPRDVPKVRTTRRRRALGEEAAAGTQPDSSTAHDPEGTSIEGGDPLSQPAPQGSVRRRSISRIDTDPNAQSPTTDSPESATPSRRVRRKPVIATDASADSAASPDASSATPLRASRRSSVRTTRDIGDSLPGTPVAPVPSEPVSSEPVPSETVLFEPEMNATPDQPNEIPAETNGSPLELEAPVASDLVPVVATDAVPTVPVDADSPSPVEAITPVSVSSEADVPTEPTPEVISATVGAEDTVPSVQTSIELPTIVETVIATDTVETPNPHATDPVVGANEESLLIAEPIVDADVETTEADEVGSEVGSIEEEETPSVLANLPTRRSRQRNGRNRRRGGAPLETEGVLPGAVAANEETAQLVVVGNADGITEGLTDATESDTVGLDTGLEEDEVEEDGQETGGDASAETRGRRRRNRRNHRSRREGRPNETGVATPAGDTAGRETSVTLPSATNTVISPPIATREIVGRVPVALVEEVFAAPTPPPAPVRPVVIEPVDLSVGAHLITQSGVPRIHIQGKPVPPVLFFGNMEGTKNAQRVLSEVRRAAKVGVHLHSTLIELPCPLSEAHYVLDDIDLRLRALLDADPEGYLMPRLVFVPARGWKREYPTEISAYSDGTTGDPALTSVRFWQEAERSLELLIEHIQSQTYGERIFGYHLERGEWFQPADMGYDRSMANRDAFRDWLREKYRHSLILLRAAWYDGDVQFHTAEIPPPPSAKPNPQRAFYETRRERSVIDFYEFTSECTAQRLHLLAQTVKKATRSNALVSVCYGYTLEFGHGFNGHLALDKLLASPYVDLICGPPSYRDRKPGGAASFPGPVDSPPLHGKLWLSEDDTKTYLAPAVQDPDDFNPRLPDRFATEQAHTRAIGRALATNTGIGWMDLWGEGWLDEESLWERIGSFAERIERQQREPGALPSPDVVILVDEKSLLHIQKGETFFRKLTNGLRDTLQRSGVAYGIYLQSDLLLRNFPTNARLYLFLNPYRLPSEIRTAIKEKLQRDNKTLAWLYAPGSCEERPTSGSGMDEAVTGTVGLTLRQQAWNSEVGSRIIDPGHLLTERLPGRELGTRERLNPSFFVDDPGATVLAEYQGSGLASVAVRNFGNWKSVFVGEPVLPLELLRGICKYAGVPLYTGTGDDIVTVGNGWITVHATREGQRTLKLPGSLSLYDLNERRIVAEDSREYRYFLRPGTTRTFCFGTRERFARLGLANLESSARLTNRASTDKSDRGERDERDGRNEPEVRPEPVRPEPKIEPRLEARQDGRQESRQEARQEGRQDGRQEARPDGRPASRFGSRQPLPSSSDSLPRRRPLYETSTNSESTASAGAPDSFDASNTPTVEPPARDGNTRPGADRTQPSGRQDGSQGRGGRGGNTPYSSYSSGSNFRSDNKSDATKAEPTGRGRDSRPLESRPAGQTAQPDPKDADDEMPSIEPFPEPRRVPLPPVSSVVNPSLRADLETLKAVLEMEMPPEDEEEEAPRPPITPLPLPKDGLPGLEAVLGIDPGGRRRRRRGGRGRGRRPQTGGSETGEGGETGEPSDDDSEPEELISGTSEIVTGLVPESPKQENPREGFTEGYKQGFHAGFQAEAREGTLRDHDGDLDDNESEPV